MQTQLNNKPGQIGWVLLYRTMPELGVGGLNDLQDYGIVVIGKIGLIVVETFY